jgi:hypothetical protein
MMGEVCVDCDHRNNLLLRGPDLLIKHNYRASCKLLLGGALFHIERPNLRLTTAAPPHFPDSNMS